MNRPRWAKMRSVRLRGIQPTAGLVLFVSGYCVSGYCSASMSSWNLMDLAAIAVKCPIPVSSNAATTPILSGLSEDANQRAVVTSLEMSSRCVAAPLCWRSARSSRSHNCTPSW